MADYNRQIAFDDRLHHDEVSVNFRDSDLCTTKFQVVHIYVLKLIFCLSKAILHPINSQHGSI